MLKSRTHFSFTKIFVSFEFRANKLHIIDSV